MSKTYTVELTREQIEFIGISLYDISEALISGNAKGGLTPKGEKAFLECVDIFNEIPHREGWCTDPDCEYAQEQLKKNKKTK